MNRDLHLYYEKELAFIKNDAKRFAEMYPKIAGRLKLGADELEDPLVERMISAFALLNAKTQQRLDDDFSEISDAILESLYPHFLQPIPSAAIVQLKAQLGTSEIEQVGSDIQFYTQPVKGTRCRFTTIYPIDVLPLNLTEAKLSFRPFSAPGSNQVEGNAILHIKLKTFDKDLKIKDLKISQLRFFLSGDSSLMLKLYELIFLATNNIVVSSGEHKNQFEVLDRRHLQSVGFNVEDGLIPYPNNAQLSFRLLTEFFVFPEKFLFLDLVNLQTCTQNIENDELDLFFYLKDADTIFESQLGADNFKLGCAPAINLFPHTCEPIKFSNTSMTYALEPNLSAPLAFEVYSVNKVTELNRKGKARDVQSFYCQDYQGVGYEQQIYWQAKRDTVIEGENNNEVASALHLNFLDMKKDWYQAEESVMSVEALCSNRNLASKLPFSGVGILYSDESAVGSLDASYITAPTPAVRQFRDDDSHWNLVSHLSLNHLSLSNNPQSLAVLKNILTLYDFRSSQSSKALIAAIHEMSTRVITAPIVVDGRSMLCQGTEITITFESIKIQGSSVFLFSQVLEVFFGLYCSLNSFTQLVVKESGKSSVLHKWPPRIGSHALI